MSQILPVLAHPLGLPDVLEHFLAVVEELVEEESVGDEHGEDAHQHVEELAEPKVELVSLKPQPEVHEVVRDLSGVGAGPDDVLQHVPLQHVPPQGTRQLGEAEAECEEEGKPEVVGSHGSVGRGTHRGLVDKTSRGLSLQVLLHVGCPVDPAVGPDKQLGREMVMQLLLDDKELGHSLSRQDRNWLATNISVFAGINKVFSVKKNTG